MPYHLYIVQCSDGTLYTGITNELECRLAAHNSGKGAKYTASRRPVALVYQEKCCNKSQALKREWAVKKLKKAEKEKLISSLSFVS